MAPDPSRYRELIALRNGTQALLRAIRPDDRERLRAAFLALEPESVYLRYFSYKSELTEADLDRLCNPDFEQRVVLVVTQQTDSGEIVVASGGYVVHPAPDGTRAAEVAFAVEEDVQGQGLGGRLLGALVGIGRAAGLACFDAEVLSRNAAMLRVFDRSGLPMQIGPEEDGVVRISLSLVAPTAGPG
jgi:RimJ/RimL family protein N-acetyltransferase